MLMQEFSGKWAMRLATMLCCCAVFVSTAQSAEYVGRQVCSECHSEINEVFMKSGHPYKLNKVVDGQPPTYSFTEVLEVPVGYTWDDISYVIGGYNWKARFIGKDGYIITGPESPDPFGAQYNFANPVVGNEANWVPYHQGEQKAYSCGTCHTTGYDNEPGTHQDDMPGMVGTWSEPGIQCENCHFKEAKYQASATMKEAVACIDCHMPRVTKSAVGNAAKFTGDIRTHLMAIDPTEMEQFTEDGKQALSQLGLTFACKSCHVAGGIALPYTDALLRKYAYNYHARPDTLEE